MLSDRACAELNDYVLATYLSVIRYTGDRDGNELNGHFGRAIDL